jgi:hypothetical protein
MAVPRPLLLAVLGLLLVSATFMATRNSGQTTATSKPTPQPIAAKPAPKPAAKAHRPAVKPAPKPAPTAKRAPAANRATASRSSDHPARRTRAVRHVRVSTPAAVTRAIEQGRVVVLAFFQKPAADDAGTKSAVTSLRGRHLASVFTDDIDHIGRYERVVGSLGIQQAPAIVIVDSHRHARLVEGYVDPESLAQEVSDAHG